jgi:hypothetical protein
MFAPRQQQAADELVRVCRPGGLVGVAAWTPEGIAGQMFKTIGSHMPPPPPELVPPTMWGNEQHVRGLFADSGVELEFHQRAVTFAYESPAAWVSYYEEALGPTIMAKAALEPEGKWEPVRAELVQLFEDSNQATDGTLRADAKYLITIARLPG